MSNFTEVFRRRKHYLAVVVFNDDGSHYLVNDKQQRRHRTKPTWLPFGPYEPGVPYIALQEFVDKHSDIKNDYTVLGTSCLRDFDEDMDQAKALSFTLYNQAKTSNLEALDDPFFLDTLVRFDLITPQEKQRFVQERAAKLAPRETKTTLVF